jgi:serine beta-lactamase-like protein LACTB
MQIARCFALVAGFSTTSLLAQDPGLPVTAPTGNPAVTVAGAPSRSAAERATEQLQAFMAARRIPGLSVAVGKGDRVVWAQAFGVADLETKAPLTTESVFPLGSTSKVFTSLALGQLVEAGKLDLDAPIQTYVPSFPLKSHPITPRQLAGHLAGLRNYDMAAGEYANTREFGSVAEAVTVFEADPLVFEPGTKHAYSVYNFVLLSAAIEGASGSDYLTLVQQRIAAPLGLVRTGPNRRATPPAGLVTSYTAGVWGVPTKTPPVDVSNKWGAGGLASTSTEMVLLGNAVLAGRVVRPETFTLLTTPQPLKDGSDSGAGYGMGWRSGRRRLTPDGPELRVVHHGGTAAGAMSFFVLIPEIDLVVSLNGNLLFEPFVDFAEQAYAVAELFRDPR